MFGLFKKKLKIEDLANAIAMAGLAVNFARDIARLDKCEERISFFITPSNEIKVIFTACDSLSLATDEVFEVQLSKGKSIMNKIDVIPKAKLVLPPSKIKTEILLASSIVGTLENGINDEVFHNFLKARERALGHGQALWVSIKMQEIML